MKLSSISRLTFSIFIVSVLLVAPLVAAKPASADPLGQITRHDVSLNFNSLGSLTTGPDGNLWFASNGVTAKIGIISSTGAILGSHALPSTYTNVDNLMSGLDNSLWFSVKKGSADYALGKLTTSGNFTFYNIPRPPDYITGASDAHSVQSVIMANGKIWLSQIQTRYIYAFSMNGTFETIEISTPGATNNSQKNSFKTTGGMTYNHLNKCVVVSTYSNSFLTAYIETVCSNSRQLMQLSANSDGYTLGGTDLSYTEDGTLWLGGVAHGWLSYLTVGGSYHYIKLPTAYKQFKPNNNAPGTDGNMWYSVTHQQGSKRSNVVMKADVSTKTVVVYPLPTSAFTNTGGVTSGIGGSVWFTETSGRVSKIGTGGAGVDGDGDGLISTQEAQQGTSDFTKDTDNDGLSDYTESQWNTTRDDVFCHPVTNYCEYPDPLQQDIYIETDWMQRPNDGPLVGYSTQPSEYTTDMFKEAFSNKGIKLHVDRGQLGGGNEVPYEEAVQFRSHETGVIDFWDYRDGGDGIAQNFASNRKDIYRYMLMGNHLADAGLETTTGVSLAGADDIFISFGLIKENPVGYSLFDVAIAGTMHHELGHSLCLSNTSDYSGQSPSCVFAGVDQLGTSDYPSAMNYLYQMVLVDYSDGTNSGSDHDDWGAISPRDFTFNESLASPAPGITIEQMKTAAKVRKEKGIKVERKNGKFEVTQTQNGRTKKLN